MPRRARQRLAAPAALPVTRATYKPLDPKALPDRSTPLLLDGKAGILYALVELMPCGGQFGHTTYYARLRRWPERDNKMAAQLVALLERVSVAEGVAA